MAAALLLLLCAAALPARARTDGDPFGSLQWPDLEREFLHGGMVEFDARVQVRRPTFAEDPMNVPIAVSAEGLTDVEVVTAIVDRHPIRKLLEYFPLGSLPAVSFRFQLEQARRVRAAVRARRRLARRRHARRLGRRGLHGSRRNATRRCCAGARSNRSARTRCSASTLATGRRAR